MRNAGPEKVSDNKYGTEWLLYIGFWGKPWQEHGNRQTDTNPALLELHSQRRTGLKKKKNQWNHAKYTKTH